MTKRWAVGLMVLLSQLPALWADHWHHHGGVLEAPDPHLDAFLWGAVLISAASCAITLLGGPVLILRLCGVRRLLGLVLVANLVLYGVSISLRSYPGGFLARFRSPGFGYTLLELLLVLLASLVVAIILAAGQWLVRKVRFIHSQKPA